VEFRVRHFWHAVVVRGWFEQVEGEGTVGPDGTVTGHLVVAAGSLKHCVYGLCEARRRKV
jgi:hypothetical protein